MSTNLNSQAVDVARAAYLAAVRKNEGPSSVVEATIRAYLEAAGIRTPSPIKRTGGVSPNTMLIAQMAVGDVITVRGMAQSSIRNAYRTARRVMENPNAKWATANSGKLTHEVRRLPDGMIGRDPHRNVMAAALADMAVGESKVLPVTHYVRHRSAYQTAKNQARRILQDEAADWSYKITSKGARITRTEDDPVKSDLREMKVPRDIQLIARRVMAKHGVTARELVDMDRRPHIAEARHEFIGRVNDLVNRWGDPRYTKVQIGRMIGRRDHSTINNSVARWEEMKAARQEARHAA